jgi:hypothetical protein
MNTLKKLLLAASLPLAFAGVAFGHATSIGYENAGPGAVTVWLGTYNHGGHHLEGSMQLQGVNGTVFGPTIVAFHLLTATGPQFKPAGLIDGVTNFFDPNGAGTNVPLVGVDPDLFGGVNHWQGATFAGLTPGDYQFTWIPIANPTQEWSPLNPNMNGIFTLTGQVVNPTGTPDAGSTLGLMAGAVALLGVLSRRRRS